MDVVLNTVLVVLIIAVMAFLIGNVMKEGYSNDRIAAQVYSDLQPSLDNYARKKSRQARQRAHIDTVSGYSSGHNMIDPPDNRNQTPEMCRQKALNSGGKYAAWGHRNETHPQMPNTCFMYTAPFGGTFKGNTNDRVHLTGCLRPGERVEWGCKSTPPVQDRLDVKSGVNVLNHNPGPLIQKKYNNNEADRYGVAQIPGGKTHLYAANSFNPSEVHMSFATGPNTYDSVIVASKNKTTGAKKATVHGKLCIDNKCITASDITKLKKMR